MIPDPLAAAVDWSDAYRDGCWIYAPFSVRTTCRYGSGKVKIALVGNSHAGQWLPTLQVLAKRHGWTIVTFLASRCNATDAELELYGGTAGCLEYGRWVMEQTRGHTYDLVITSERQSVTTNGDDRPETRKAAEDGYASYLTRWSKAGTNVLVLRDTPFPGHTLNSVPDCLASHRSKQAACAGPRRVALDRPVVRVRPTSGFEGSPPSIRNAFSARRRRVLQSSGRWSCTSTSRT